MSPTGLRDKVTMITELKVYLPDDLDTRFRKAAMSAFGYGRGSLSKAAAEALVRWCSEQETRSRSPETSLPTNTPDSVPRDIAQVNGQASSVENLKGPAQAAT